MLEKLLAAVIALTAALEKASGGKASVAASTPAAAKVTVDQVRDKMKVLMDSKGKEAVVAVLAAVGAKKLGDVKEEMLAACMAKADEALAAAAPAADGGLF